MGLPALRSAILQQELAATTLLLGKYAVSCAHAGFATLPGATDKSESEPSRGTTVSPAQLSAASSMGQRMMLVKRGFASGQVSTTSSSSENSWSKFRGPGFERKSSLNAMMYATIAVFGFAHYLNDMIYHPPRVVAMVGLMMLLMYVRRPK